MRRPPKETYAYLVGGGIASLTAAVHLYYDAGVPADHIHIIEAAPLPGGAMGKGGSSKDKNGNEIPDWQKGYTVLAARKLNFSYRCLYETLAKVPSARHPGQTVLDDVRGSPVAIPEAEMEAIPKSEGEKTSSEFELIDVPSVDTPAALSAPQPATSHPAKSSTSLLSPTFPARLVARGPDGRPEVVNVQNMELLPAQRMSLLGLILATEDSLAAASVSQGKSEIQAHFQPDFFESKFWDVWASLYGFQPWHSAVEFRRYLLRFLHEFSHISTLAGIDHAPLNDYECIVLPIEQHLRELGIDFRYNTRVEEVIFAEGDHIVVSTLRTTQHGTQSDISLGPHDIVFLTLGSMTAGVLFGGNDRAPPPLPTQEAVLRDPGPVWRFWDRLADPVTNPVHHAAFGRPSIFYSHIAKSSWLSFTVTLSGEAAALFTHLTTWAGFGESSASVSASASVPSSSSSMASSSGPPEGTNTNGPLITFRDSPWMMSITMPHQPYFTDQPADVRVLWGYGLYPDQEGLHIRKPMMACTGAEIFAELISYLDLPGPLASLLSQPSPPGVITIPCLMPFIGSPFLTRTAGDRPDVLPGRNGKDDGNGTNKGNIGLLGQFVEIDRDVTFTMEYSARSAQMAVYGLMGIDDHKAPPPVHRTDQDVQVLGEMLMTIMS